MSILEHHLDYYIEKHTSPEPAILNELNRTTHLDVLRPQMLSGEVQGAFLRMLSQMIKPACVLEIGTYTGYSAICLTAGMPNDGKLYTIDVNEEITGIVRQYIAKAGLDHLIEPMIGNAAEIIPTMDKTFDLVFIDADKVQYSLYYDLVFDKVKQGGYIIADNVLWYGKVAEDQIEDRDTDALRAYNDKIQADPRVENVLLSVRDGLMVARKK